MLPDTDPPLLERFRAGIAARLGLTFDDSRESDLASVLSQRAQANHLTPERYVAEIASASAELPELAQRLTVPETYFFRNQPQLDAFVDGAVPACLAGRTSPGLRILSAACASGEEPYSLAILLRERRPECAAATKLLGVDINPVVLQRARLGRYSAWSLRETPEVWKARYFQAQGTDYVLDASIRAAVQFEAMNLVEPGQTQLLEASYDIVFCRNVLMYFTAEQFAHVVSELARALVPGGFLFLGHAETLRGVSQDFTLCHACDAFYYRRRRGPLRTSRPPGSTDLSMAAAAQPAIEPTVIDTRALTGRSADAAEPSNPRRHAQLLDLLQKEQFTEALAVLQHEQPGDDSDHALMRAIVAAQAGRFDTARQLCETLLEHDDLDAGAQYVLGLCHDHEGDLDRALYCDQLAAYLDPGFAMPRVHMGLVYRRLGNAQAADRELREARRLLEREDAARLLLFGGGFGRAALLALCDAELALRAREAR